MKDVQVGKGWFEVVGERVSRRRQALGWSQEVLAREVGQSVRSIRAIEAGRTSFSFQFFIELAFALGVDAGDLSSGLLPPRSPSRRISMPKRFRPREVTGR
jgi:transcriptional regulator with XRE-family HTH domain